ncbi:MAG: DoxX family protein [Gemmatimonadota bacterium]
MTSAVHALPGMQKRPVAGYILTALVALFLAFDTTLKVLGLPAAVQGTMNLGYPAQSVVWIGTIQLICLVLYLVPRTTVLGAVLLTGYLGGAVASQVRVEAPLFSHVLFPIYTAALMWGGVYLRETRVRAVVPVRR